jgi:hypothetical protein
MTVALPSIDPPFSARLHPLTGVAAAGTAAWAERWGLTSRPELARRLRETDPARLAGRVCPGASLEGLQLNSDWQAWLFLFDDAYCDESEIGSDPAATTEVTVWMLGALEDGEAAPDDVFARALADLCARLDEMAGPVQRLRFRQEVTTYLYSLVWEAARRRERMPAQLPEYIRMRRHCSAVPTCLALIDVVNGFELSQELWCSEPVRSAARAATDVTCWTNDVLSLPKEEERSTELLSLPAVLGRRQGLGPDDALRRCAAMIDERIHEFLEAQQPLLESGDPALVRLCADLRHWIAGNLAWSRETGRYRVTAG